MERIRILQQTIGTIRSLHPLQEVPMSQYAVYIRTKEGSIERMQNVICGFSHISQAQFGSLAPYVHEEPLEGFPESVVLWARSIGPTVGIPRSALVRASAITSLRHSAGSAAFLPRADKPAESEQDVALPCIIAASLVIAGVKQMANFVYYLRNTDGCIKRVSNVIAIGPTGLLGGYKHEEQITGFPEPTGSGLRTRAPLWAWRRLVLILSARQGKAELSPHSFACHSSGHGENSW
jgi:hypothetical protein